jgi:hypothetical protein
MKILIVEDDDSDLHWSLDISPQASHDARTKGSRDGLTFFETKGRTRMDSLIHQECTKITAMWSLKACVLPTAKLKQCSQLQGSVS